MCMPESWGGVEIAAGIKQITVMELGWVLCLQKAFIWWSLAFALSSSSAHLFQDGINESMHENQVVYVMQHSNDFWFLYVWKNNCHLSSKGYHNGALPLLQADVGHSAKHFSPK